MSKSIKLFSVTHKAVSGIPTDRSLIVVGNAENVPLARYADNTGTNIAEKNQNYCELTALYWIWKNLDADYIGFEHYRRFFCGTRIFKATALPQKKIMKILNGYDLILPQKVKAKPSVYKYYVNHHFKEDMDICLKIIYSDYPTYSEAAKAVMQSQKLSLFNMFIMPKYLLNEYCEWLFGILFKAEREIDITGREAYQQRVFGFLAERLFNIWLYKKNLKAYYTPVYNVGDCPIRLKFKNLFRKIKKRLIR